MKKIELNDRTLNPDIIFIMSYCLIFYHVVLEKINL